MGVEKSYLCKNRVITSVLENAVEHLVFKLSNASVPNKSFFLQVPVIIPSIMLSTYKKN